MNNNKNWIGDLVAKVLTKGGGPEKKHSMHVGHVLDMSSTAATKKLAGGSEWRVQQLMDVVHSVGMTLDDFFRYYYQEQSNKNIEVHDAVWSDGDLSEPCKIYISENPAHPTNYSAIKIKDVWHVVKTKNIKDDVLFDSKMNIDLIEITPRALEKSKHRIAVLDDDETIVHNLARLLDDGRYVVQGFYNIDELDEAISKEPFDAYILDWVVGTGTVFNTIKEIRSSENNHAMIMVLTGQLSGAVDSEISCAINDFDIIGPYEKPIKSIVIKSNVDKCFPKD
ncbi:helix-turn-helix domain-containing protein [Serratia ficaria]|uniref:helix-turn-helix domain-containing protein n=1 Tax=Serratia ficaria TaxID=61651 RepID=UPI000B078D88|nr:helix-turn-helix domain-containing protein [Serratia ficaria]